MQDEVLDLMLPDIDLRLACFIPAALDFDARGGETQT
jgi:hypothetical protein